MADPLFWETRARLEQVFGPKVPLKDLIPFMHQMASNLHLCIPREAVRRKNSAISWVCQHIKESEPLLATVSTPAREEELDARVQRNWRTIPIVKAWLREKFGPHPKMSEITAAATAVATTSGLSIDRQARRSKAALECWLAENWETTGPPQIALPFETFDESAAIDPEFDSQDSSARLINFETPQPF
jgi:hypothetical protein